MLFQCLCGFELVCHFTQADDEPDFFTYLSEVVSFENYDGVPTMVRNYSLKIHLCFKEGTANGEIANLLEEIFQKVKKRKEMTDENEIKVWNNEYREKVRELRKSLGKYCGGL